MSYITRLFQFVQSRKKFVFDMLFRDRLIKKEKDFETSREYEVIANTKSPRPTKSPARKAA
jgi:hypothetical protein